MADNPLLNAPLYEEEEESGGKSGLLDAPLYEDSANDDVMTDPAFSQFVDIQERLPAAFGSEQAELRQEMLALRDELTTKYDLTPDRLSELAGRGLPDDIGEEGRAAGGSFSIDIDPGRVLRGGLMAGADLLEPLLQPQQMLFRDAMTAMEQREEFMRQADAYRRGEREEPPEINPPVDIGVGEVDWGRVFGPGLQDNFVTFGDVLKSAGVPEDQSVTVSVFNPPGAQSLRARVTGEEAPEGYNPVVERELNTVRTLGLFGDILVDPLLAGPFLGGLGRAARSAGMLKAGDDLIKAGQQVERGMSPMGARAAAKAVAPKVVEGTEARIGGFLNYILSQPGPRRTGQDFSIGEWIFPRGRVPGRAMREGEQPPDIFTGGTGRPEELVTAERVNEARVDDVLSAVTERAAGIREALGAERYSTWARSFGGAVSRRVRAFKRAESLPTELRDSVQTLAAEVVDNRGIMLSPESMEELGSFTLRRTPVTGDGTIFGRESVVAGTLGEELQSLQPFLSETEAAQSASDLYDTNLERVRRAARKAGVDEDRAVAAFDYIVNQANQADVIAGFHMSQYEPIKGKFFEHVAAAGGNADDAGYLWEEAFRYALEGENLSRFAADVSEEGFEAVTAEARRADRLYREWLSGGSETAFPEELRKLIRRDPNAKRVVLGHVFNQVGAQQLDIGAFFNSLRDGHLRRAYATGQTDRSYRALARQIESGGSFTNRIIDSTMYGSRIEGKVRPGVQDLIADYVETVSPTVPTERGFLIRQENLVNHLLDNGVSPMEAQKAIRAVGEAATRTPAQTLVGEGYTETSLAGRELRDIFAGREGAAEQRAAAGRTGQSFTSERLEGMEIAPASRQERLQQIQEENPFISESEAGRRLRELETSEFTDHLDTDTMGVLGRLFDPELSVQETGRALRSQYPKSRFLFDAEKYARQAGAVVDDKAAAPERWALLDSEGYGPLNGKYVHPWLKKEVDNVLKAADSGQNARAFNRVRSALTSSWLTSPVTVAANHAGGTLGAVLQGANPFSHLRRVADFYRQVNSKKGLGGVEHYDDMSDLFQTGLGQDNLARNLQSKHLSGANLTREKIPDFLSNKLSQIYTRVNRRPIPGLGRLVGLDAFQLSENAHKWARYKDVLEETGDKARAYRAAREVTFDYCVDEETEALTKRGWLKHHEIDPNSDEVLTLNPETNVSEWQPLHELYVGEKREREMRHLKTSTFDALVTPDHRWITETVVDRTRHMKRLRDFNKNELIVASGGEYSGPSQKTYSDEFVELIGWHVTEGTNQKDGYGGVQIAQSLKANPEYVGQLRVLADYFRQSGATVSEYQRDIGWGIICSFYFGRGIGMLIQKAAPDKRLTPEFLNALTKPQLKLLFDTLIAADGHINAWGAKIFYQKDQGRLNGFQYLASMLGIRTNIRGDGQSVGVYKSRNVYFADLGNEAVTYHGHVWCPVTPNGTWFARRNGVTYWTGNTSMPELLRVGNDTGLTPFVAFPYFMTGRVISAALNKPGVLGAADRVANSVWNAVIPNEDIQYALNRELEDWEKDARYVPIRERGDAQWSMFPLGQLLPTAPWQENPYMGNLQQFGIYSGVIDMGYAQMNQGEAAFGAQYGQRVFEATAEGGEKSRQMGAFIYNNYAPAWLRNLAAPGTGGDEMTGLIPDVAKAFKPLVGDGMEELHRRMVEVETGRLNKDWFEQASSYLLRQTRPVSINPLFSRVLRERSGRNYEQDEELRALNRQLTEIVRDPNLSEGAKRERMQQLISRTVNIEVGQAQRMMDVLQGYQTLQNQR